MADSKTIDLPEDASPSASDWIETVDVSDATDEARGSSKKVHPSALPLSSAATSALAGKAALSHTHAIADTTGLQAALDGKQAAGSYATADQGTKADSALQPAGNGSSLTGLTKSQVGLGSVDNTADAAKPVSTATQTAMDLKAPLASPALTGTPTAPTAAPGTDTTQVATTAFVLANAPEAAGDLLAANNLSDLDSPGLARTNLGLGGLSLLPGLAPEAISGLTAIYRAESSGVGPGESLATWADLGPGGYDLAPNAGPGPARVILDDFGRVAVKFAGTATAYYSNASVPLDRASNTYAVVITPADLVSQYQTLMRMTGGSLGLMAVWHTGMVTLIDGDGSTHSPVNPPLPGPLVCIIATDGSTIVVRVNGVEVSTAFTPTAGVNLGLAIGWGSPFAFSGLGYEFAAFDRALNLAERRSLERFLAAKYRAPLPGQVGRTALGLAFDGDSITYGAKATKVPNQATELVAAWVGRGDIEYRNFGRSGRTNGPEFLTSQVAAFASADRVANAVIFGFGTNDFWLNWTATQFWADVQTYATQAKAAGYATVICRTPPASGSLSSGQEAERQAYLRLIEAGWRGTNIDAISHVGIDPRMGLPGTFADEAYFDPDHLHPSDGGHRVIADHDIAALQSLGVVPGRPNDIPRFHGGTADVAQSVPIKGYKLPYNSVTTLRVMGCARRLDSGSESVHFHKEFRVVVGAAAGTPTVTTKVIAANDYATLATADVTCVVVGDRGVDVVIAGEAGKTIGWTMDIERATLAP